MIASLMTPVEGIYSITVRSEFNGFCQWYMIHVDRSPSSSYVPPEEYVLVSKNESVSPSGVAVTETYMPKIAMDIQKLILVLPGNTDVDVPVLSLKDMSDLAAHALDISYVFGKLLKKVNSESTVFMTSRTQSKYVAFGELFTIPEYVFNGLVRTQRASPMSIMQSVYAGLGLIVRQGAGGVELTDLTTVMKAGGITVEAENIVSITSGYDFTRIPKTQTINHAADGGLSDQSITESPNMDTIIDKEISNARGESKDDMLTKTPPGASLSQAVGTAVHKYAKPVPLIHRANLRNVTVDSEGMATVQLVDRKVTVQLCKLAKAKDSMISKKDIKDKEISWDYSAALVIAKRLFYQQLQELMSYEVLQASTAKTAVIDIAQGGAFMNMSFAGGEVALQKAVISLAGVTTEVETGSLDDQGFVTGLSATMQAGLVTTSLTYINLKEAYEGIM